MKILTFVQQNDGKINSNSLEALKGSQDIANAAGGTVTALTFNPQAGDQVTGYDVSNVIVVDNTELSSYQPLHFLSTFEQIIANESPDLIVFGHTYQTRDWVPRLSARLKMPFIADCIGFKFEEQLKFVRGIYQGKVNADISVDSLPCMVSFQSGAFRADELSIGSSSVNTAAIDLSGVHNTIRPGEKFQESESTVDLTQAEVIVSVGRGIAKEENLNMVKELAEVLGGSVASSRPIVDSGWLEPYHQIGSSGQTVAPKLYIALGISGAIQHVVGMKGSQNVVVINKDSNAPFFELADYGVVGDILDIIPKLTTAIQES